MNKLRQWSLLTGVASVGVLVLGWFLLVAPQRSHASSLRSQTAQVQQTNQSLANNVAMLRAQARNLPADQAWLDQFASQIPNNPALPSLIRQLSSAADDAGVELVSLAPAQPAALPASTSSVATLPSGSTTATTGTPSAVHGPVASTPSAAYILTTITVSGSYFNIEQFLDNVEHMPRALLVGQMSLVPGSPQGTSTGAGSTSTSGTGTTGSAGATPSMLTATISARVFMTQSTVVPTTGVTK